MAHGINVLGYEGQAQYATNIQKGKHGAARMHTQRPLAQVRGHGFDVWQLLCEPNFHSKIFHRGKKRFLHRLFTLFSRRKRFLPETWTSVADFFFSLGSSLDPFTHAKFFFFNLFFSLWALVQLSTQCSSLDSSSRFQLNSTMSQSRPNLFLNSTLLQHFITTQKDSEQETLHTKTTRHNRIQKTKNTKNI